VTQDGSTRHTPARRAQGAGAVALLVVHAALLVAAIVLFVVFASRLHPSPRKDPNNPACQLLQKHDDLVHLPLRSSEAEARAQLKRWNECDPSMRGRAQDALWWDAGFIAVLTGALAVGIVNCLRRPRWRLAAILVTPLALAYLAADITEDILLGKLLGHPPSWHEALPWASAIKFGALIGALPIFVVSFALVIGDFVSRKKDARDEDARDEDARDEDARDEREHAEDQIPAGAEHEPRATLSWKVDDRKDVVRSPRFHRRWWARLHRGPRETFFGADSTERNRLAKRAQVEVGEPVDSTCGISCSGGGIRSAAFNLGALQAMDMYKGADTHQTELARARWLSAVSGGSYLAAAWTSARSSDGESWARGSLEEDHLRRHASYLAPGLAGKVAALFRFLAGFVMNLGLVVLFLGVVFLPYGWLIDRAEEHVPASGGGEIALPQGGCLQLGNGKHFAVLPGQTLNLAPGATARVVLRAPIVAEPTSGTGSPEASVEISGGKDGKVSSSVKGSGTAEASADLPDGSAASGSATIEPPSSTSPTVPREVSCEEFTTLPAGFGKGTPVGTPGLKLPAGTQVRLKLTRVNPQPPPTRVEDPLAVTGRARGCTLSTKTGDCTALDARVAIVRSGSLLYRSPRTVLTLNENAVVEDGGLVKACGSHPCEKVAVPKWLGWSVLTLVGLAVVIGLVSIAARPRERTRLVSKRGLRWLIVVGAVLVIVVYLIPFLIVWFERERWMLEDNRPIAGVVGFLTLAAAMVAKVVPFTGSAAAPSASGNVASAFKFLGSKLRPMLVWIASVIVGPLLMLGIAVFFGSLAAQQGFNEGQLALWLALYGVLSVIVAGADLNQWSLHPYYRERLECAFGVDPTTQQPRGPAKLVELPAPRSELPELVICAAANVADDRVTAPGRPVAPWVFNRDAFGAAALGRVFKTSGITSPDRLDGKLLSLQMLWTTVAVSGAAVSPAMGKMTRPERALLALGNIRLGVWYPNPSLLEADPDWYQTHHARPTYLFKEAFGIHRADDPWIYVTDGGHYENLGLVELLRRGCRRIYCFDASGDSTDTFGTMADAMRLAREELKIEIDFDPEGQKANKDGISKTGVRVAQINEWDDAESALAPCGWIVFAKLEVPENGPFDIKDLARTLPHFPNNPTADQLYTDQKFEAYRALGFYLGYIAAKIGSGIREAVALGASIPVAVKAANDELTPPPVPAGDPPVNVAVDVNLF
jgi:hypothetical protein